MGWIILWLIFGIAAAVVARNRGSSGGLWFFLGVLLGPLGWVLAFTTGTRCPYCDGKISNRATICKYCQKQLSGQPNMKYQAVDELNANMVPEDIIKCNADNYKKIRALADLRDKKMITQEQFEAYKAKLI